ncbi:hypothetical protein M4I21_17095 [Cellulophaga sp. 20_2_10]|uniref:hypothetical protein n=1 Tax=Cellulophaga sp. 20_2_10 TaxID=2942476 RepID=UPI00201A2A1B|nr:hypothetical protein [Cellulophaga sp. 20_2_10]MCL5247541.1 hypothetical protein [Cellulophaga sp. 20_2_10]
MNTIIAQQKTVPNNMKNCILILIVLLSFNSFSQKKEKDTMYIKYDKSLLIRERKLGDVDFVYRIKGTENNGFVYFLEKEKFTNLKVKEVKCLKKILQESEVHYKNDKLDDWKVAEYFGQFIIFIVDENEFIKVQTWYEIE